MPRLHLLAIGQLIVRTALGSVIGAALGGAAGTVYGLLWGTLFGALHGDLGRCLILGMGFAPAGAAAGALVGIAHGLFAGADPPSHPWRKRAPEVEHLVQIVQRALAVPLQRFRALPPNPPSADSMVNGSPPDVRSN